MAAFCDSKCGVRCSKAGYQERCLKYCGICCEKCHCVPSGLTETRRVPLLQGPQKLQGQPQMPLIYHSPNLN
ncbi:Gibberellin-regulated family protein [Prunus dulcis]|uniref:Gibberellin-regulated family protein n=1 Tax=Prunus dulcis TaxID=3755 RepID=A0A4Y1QTH3_PRUDU|nr:Gibberellin-regulated family protein [Prunus dulcis]